MKIEEIQELESIDPNDEAIAISNGPQISKKKLKAIVASMGGIVTLALTFAFQTPELRTAQSIQEELLIEPRQPSNLRVQDSDFFVREPSVQTIFLESPPQQQTVRQDTNPTVITPTVVNRPQQQTQQPTLLPQSQPTITNQNQQTGPQADPALTSSMTFSGVLPVSQMGGMGGAGPNGADLIARAQIEGQRSNEVLNQNQQIQKVEFLASQNSSFDTYLNSAYENAIAISEELVAGTVIPIVLITGINSDLPGQIIGQVVQNVWDTHTGNNILIPAGSRVIGTYDSAIAFGQSRVLVVWNQLVRPDGVTLNLRGMQGADLQGYAGLSDRVNFHIASIIETMLMASAFEVGSNAVVAAISSLNIFESLKDLMRPGEGATSSAQEEFVSSYAQRALNRQPTIEIREGFRSFIVVNKTIILPPFTAW